MDNKHMFNNSRIQGGPKITIHTTTTKGDKTRYVMKLKL